MYFNSSPVIDLVPSDEVSGNASSSAQLRTSLADFSMQFFPVAVNDSNIPVSVATETVTLPKTETMSSQGTSPVLNDKLAFKERMKEILSCRICTELRRSPIYQCKYGHLICAGCFNDILAESRLQNEIASCPHCQTTITKDLCFRNVAVEKTISELPIECPHCFCLFPPENFNYHKAVICENRPAVCSNSIIGCSWRGTNVQKPLHEKECSQPSSNGYEILKSLAALDEQQKEGVDLYNKIMELLSAEKISYTDLQFKQTMHGRTLFFETSKFNAFESTWFVRACCIKEENKDAPPSLFCTSDSFHCQSINYQLIIKNKLIRSDYLRGSESEEATTVQIKLRK